MTIIGLNKNCYYSKIYGYKIVFFIEFLLRTLLEDFFSHDTYRYTYNIITTRNYCNFVGGR